MSITLTPQICSWGYACRLQPGQKFEYNSPTFNVYWDGIGAVIWAGSYNTGYFQGRWNHCKFSLKTDIGEIIEQNAWISSPQRIDISHMFNPDGITKVSMKLWLNYGNSPDGDSIYWAYENRLDPEGGAVLTTFPDPELPGCKVDIIV